MSLTIWQVGYLIFNIMMWIFEKNYMVIVEKVKIGTYVYPQQVLLALLSFGSLLFRCYYALLISYFLCYSSLDDRGFSSHTSIMLMAILWLLAVLLNIRTGVETRNVKGSAKCNKGKSIL